MKIALASDHAGFEISKELEEYLEELGHEIHNFGPKKFNPQDDYPDFIMPAAKAVSDGECNAGVVLGGSGQGEAMAANRFRGVRCAVFYGPAVAKSPVDIEGDISHDPHEIVRLERQHNGANMLSIAVRFVSLEEMKRVIKIWLDTAFSNEERHLRRINKLDA